jgi:hypothetical protein
VISVEYFPTQRRPQRRGTINLNAPNHTLSVAAVQLSGGKVNRKSGTLT